VYHLELRQFPHNLCRFNLKEQELRVIVEPWARGQWVELGERKWSPHQARLTILEGPRIPMAQLSMGRGWRNAQRQSQDVTERLLAPAQQIERSATGAPPRDSVPAGGALADSLALELLSLLVDAPAPLSLAWRLASERCPDRSAGECLTLAEQAVRSLLRSSLIVLLPAGTLPADGLTGADAAAGKEEVELLLRAVLSWTGDGESGGVRIRRA
jgi:hypothetical protein